MLLQFIRINIYIRSILPTIRTPKRLYVKKILNTKIAQNFKIKSFATQQIFKINDNQKHYNQKH
jgi:hypothetical protein